MLIWPVESMIARIEIPMISPLLNPKRRGYSVAKRHRIFDGCRASLRSEQCASGNWPGMSQFDGLVPFSAAELFAASPLALSFGCEEMPPLTGDGATGRVSA